MLTLYRRPDDARADEVQDTLDEIVIAYQTETIADDTTLPDDVPDTPALRDDGEVISGEAALNEHLQKLTDLMNDWDRFQSDACYIEDDGTVC
jgi:hypothetical protein